MSRPIGAPSMLVNDWSRGRDRQCRPGPSPLCAAHPKCSFLSARLLHCRLAAHLAFGGLVGCTADTAAKCASNANVAGYPQATLEVGCPAAGIDAVVPWDGICLHGNSGHVPKAN